MDRQTINRCYTNTYSLVRYHASGFENTSEYLQINSCGYCEEIPDLEPVSRPHGRRDFFLSYSYSGDMYVETNGEELLCSSGDLLLYAPEEPQVYRYDCTKHLSNYWIHFTGYGASQFIEMLDIPTQVPYHLGYIPEIKHFIQKIILEINGERPGSILYATSLFAVILSLINKKKAENMLPDNHEQNEHIYQTVDYIQHHLSAKISISHLASMSFLSANRYTNVFKSLLGTTPQEYIIRLRLQKALQLLKDTDWTITRIASTIGYHDSMYFSRLFKKYYQISPSEFRSRIRNSD